MLNYDDIFQIKYAEAILSNRTWKLLWFEITKTLIAVLKNKCIVTFSTIFGTLAFPIIDQQRTLRVTHQMAAHI